MRLQRHNPLLPYVGILLSLLLFSMAAPRAWQQSRRGGVLHGKARPEAPNDPRLITRRGDFELSKAVEMTPSLASLTETKPATGPVDIRLTSGPVFPGPAFPGPAFPGTTPEPIDDTALEPVADNRYLVDEGVPFALRNDTERTQLPPIEICSPTEIPPLNIDPFRQRWVARGERAVQTASRSIAAVAHSPAWLREVWLEIEANIDISNDEPLASDAGQDRETEDAAIGDSEIVITDQSINALTGNLFARPAALIEEVNRLATDPHAGAWAKSTLYLLEVLPHYAVEEVATADTIRSLAASAVDARRLAATAPAPPLRASLVCTHHGLLRRVELYQAVLTACEQYNLESAKSAGSHHLAASVAELETIVQHSPHGPSWCEYLRLDDLGKAADDDHRLDATERLELARFVLRRITSTDLTPGQQAFLRTPPVQRLGKAVGHWVAGPVDIPRLLKRIERYEETASPALGRSLATDVDRLRWSTDAGSRQLVETLQRHYRNANLRLAISGEMLTRMLPKQNHVVRAVRDQIAGTNVTGRSRTETKLSVRLYPDPRAIRIALEARGTVNSATASESGPAVFHSTGLTHYVAKKLFILSDSGLKSQPAVANAVAGNRLQALETRFDGIPLVDMLVRSIALKEHDRSHGQTLSEIEHKVAHKARRQMDEESTRKLAIAQQRFRDKILTPIRALALDTKAVDLRTTAERMTVRMRFAQDGQVAAHTPRPAALADSEMSLQLHESALNNGAMQLGLEGQEYTMEDLYHTVGKKLGKSELTIPDDVPLKTRIKFARHDAISIRCDDGLVHLTLSIAKLKHRRTAFYNFKVHAIYRPQLDGLHLRFVRNGVLDIEGARLRPGEHIALQGIFVKILTLNRPITVIPPERNSDPRLAGLMVTQLVLNDGWFGLSIGPGHPRRTARLAR